MHLHILHRAHQNHHCNSQFGYNVGVLFAEGVDASRTIQVIS